MEQLSGIAISFNDKWSNYLIYNCRYFSGLVE